MRRFAPQALGRTHARKMAAPWEGSPGNAPGARLFACVNAGYSTPIAALAVPSSVMQASSSPASACICAFLSAVMASARPPAEVLMSPTREVSSTVPLGIVVVVLELELEPSAGVSLPPLCGCCTPGSVGPMVALAPVLSAVVVLLPVVALASGAGCCTPGSVVPMVALAPLLLSATWSSVGVTVVLLLSAEALGLGCCTPGSVAPMVALAPSSRPSFCCSSATCAPQLPAALAVPAAMIRLAPTPNMSAVLFIYLSTVLPPARHDRDMRRLALALMGKHREAGNVDGAVA